MYDPSPTEPVLYTESEVRDALLTAFDRGRVKERAEHSLPGLNGHSPKVVKAGEVSPDCRAALDAYRAAEGAYRGALAALKAKAGEHANAIDTAESAFRSAILSLVTAGGKHDELFDALVELAGSYNPTWAADTKRTHFKDAEHLTGLFLRENRRRQSEPGSLSTADLSANDSAARTALTAITVALDALASHRAALATWEELGGVEDDEGDDSPVTKAVRYVESEHPRAADGEWVKVNGTHITKRHVDDARGNKAAEDELRRVVHPDDREMLEEHFRHAPDSSQRAFNQSSSKHSSLRNLGWAAGNKLVDEVGRYLDKIEADGPLTPEERRDLTVHVATSVRSKRLPELRNMLRSMAVGHGEFAGKSKRELQSLIEDKVKAAAFDAETRWHERAGAEEGDEHTARRPVGERAEHSAPVTAKALDAAGHEHKPSGPGGGQFTATAGGGTVADEEDAAVPAKRPKKDKPLTDADRTMLADAGLPSEAEYHALKDAVRAALKVSPSDLDKPTILLWHGTSLKGARGIVKSGGLSTGQRGTNATASLDHAAQYPEDTGADAIVLLRAKTSGLGVDKNDQVGETVKDGLFPKNMHGSSCEVGDHEVVAVLDLRSNFTSTVTYTDESGKEVTETRTGPADAKQLAKAWKALEKGDLLGALHAGANVMHHPSPAPSHP